MDISDYHRHPAISKSHLDAINLSPLHYWSRFVDPNRQPPTPTPAMEFGSAVHAAVLEPELFTASYKLAPDLPKTTKAGKEAWAAASEPGIQLLKADDWNCIQSIRDVVFQHPMASKVLTADGKAEQSLFAVDDNTGLEIKCRPDYLTDSGWLIDLKTTQDASLDGFQRTLANFRYHVQAAHYLRTYTLATGNKPKGFLFVAVEKTYPFAVQVFKCSDEMLSAGLITVLRNLEQLHESFILFDKETKWPSYSNTIMEVNLPPWARN